MQTLAKMNNFNPHKKVMKDAQTGTQRQEGESSSVIIHRSLLIENSITYSFVNFFYCFVY